MPSIAHFEIPADDIERAQKFYREVFGWSIEKADGPFEYYMIRTTTKDGQPGLGGGMIPRQHPQHQITAYIDVPSIEETAQKILAEGGQIVLPKTPVPGAGWFCVCLDSEQNMFSLWEAEVPSA